MTQNTCLICGHLDGDHGNGYCTKASGGPCICIRYTPRNTKETHMNPYTHVVLDAPEEKAVKLLNSILLKLHDDDMVEEYDLIADLLDRLDRFDTYTFPPAH